MKGVKGESIAYLFKEGTGKRFRQTTRSLCESLVITDTRIEIRTHSPYDLEKIVPLVRSLRCPCPWTSLFGLHARYTLRGAILHQHVE